MDTLVAFVTATLAWITDGSVVAIGSTIATIAAIAAVIIGARQIRSQSRRWRHEDERIAPKVTFHVGPGISDEGWFHAVWEAENRAPFDITVQGLKARKPRSLALGVLD